MVSVHNFIVFGFNRNYFFISPTSDGSVYIDKQIVHKSLVVYGMLRYLVCCHNHFICHMLTVALCHIATSVYIYTTKVMTVEEVLYCVSLMLFQILRIVFQKKGSNLRIILANPLEQLKKKQTKQMSIFLQHHRNMVMDS